ncbi:hypothetical protein HW132_24800 [Brasilonema sp. CT11]|nr:hypothetical protein [Brasilonema sp. CT11]
MRTGEPVLDEGFPHACSGVERFEMVIVPLKVQYPKGNARRLQRSQYLMRVSLTLVLALETLLQRWLTKAPRIK